tara:strand:+ start:37 stop:276 length:240 start_codon:yes stop_codon:yes gene_type:complete
MAKVQLMVASLFTTHLLVTTTPTAGATVDLDALVAVMGITERTLSLEPAKAQAMSKAVRTVAVAVAQEPHGQAHQVMAA